MVFFSPQVPYSVIPAAVDGASPSIPFFSLPLAEHCDEIKVSIL